MHFVVGFIQRSTRLPLVVVEANPIHDKNEGRLGA
jgi:hypothetical protein